jgi:hypothetical protein
MSSLVLVIAKISTTSILNRAFPFLDIPPKVIVVVKSRTDFSHLKSREESRKDGLVKS